VQGDIERVLFDEPALLWRLDEIAAQISKNYRELPCIGVPRKELVK
jgi:hypothetical protein